RFTPVAGVIDPLLALPADADHPTLAPWADVVTFAVDLVARGRFHPGTTPSGLDAWRAGPFTPADERYLGALASALPAPGYALAVRDDDVTALVGDAGTRLAAAGIDVLVPAELAARPQVRAVIGTPQPGAVTAAGFTLASLLRFRWAVSIEGQDLTADELTELA